MSNRRTEIRRYARALAEQSHRQQLLPALRAGLEQWTRTLASPTPLAVALANPGIPLPERGELVERIGRELGVHEVVQRVVDFLLEHNRLSSLPDLARALEAEADRLEDRVRVQLRSAHPLSKEQELRLLAAFRRQLGREVVLEKEVDPSLVGGIVATAGDLSFDGSIRSRLRHLGEHLKQQALGEPHSAEEGV
ncbi:MAG: ATP synthase F1 subunit delta [Deltaproteobacteria bacterium]|nr:ATP synthase F1 subunit delta [Deltaproteobacteria bacterium]